MLIAVSITIPPFDMTHRMHKGTALNLWLIVHNGIVRISRMGMLCIG